MIDLVYTMMSQLGFEGLGLRIATSFSLAFILCAALVGIGSLVNYIELIQMELMMHVMPRKVAFIVCNYVTFIGTVLHETAHAFVGFITGAKITEFKPLEISKSGRLGHVSFKTRGSKAKQAFQLSMTSCAPTLSGLIWCYVLLRTLINHSLPWSGRLLLIYLLISIFDHMSMSDVDVKNYMKGMLVVFPITMFIMFGLVHLYVARLTSGQI